MKGWQRMKPLPAWGLSGTEVEQSQGRKRTFLLGWCFLGKAPQGAEFLGVMKTEGSWAHPQPLNHLIRDSGKGPESLVSSSPHQSR